MGSIQRIMVLGVLRHLSDPGLYLLDKDRKIIAKKIDTNTLDMILNEELIVRKGLDQKTVNKLRGISDDSDNNSKSAKASKSGKDKKKK